MVSGEAPFFSWKNDPQPSAVGERHTFAEMALAAQAVQHPRNRAGVLAQFARLALEAVDFLNHLNGDEHMVFLEVEDGVGVVEEDVGVEDVVLHNELDKTAERCGETQV